jgi:electron transfer flavoprotein beta subunit
VKTGIQLSQKLLDSGIRRSDGNGTFYETINISTRDFHMKILVPTKKVTDPEIKVKVNDDGTGIELSDMVYKVNPFDEIAVEEALRIKEKKGGEVVIVTIDDEKSIPQIRSALSMGADRAILILSEKIMDSDVIARILAKVVQTEQPDIVLMGKQSVDCDNNQTAQMLAEYLGWGQACFASKVEIEESVAKVHREVDAGIEIIEVDLPAVISADLRLNEPRFPSLPLILKAKRKELKKITTQELGVDVTPKVEIKSMADPPQRKGGRILADVSELITALKEEAKVI